MRGAALSLVPVLLIAATTDPVDARGRKRSSHHAAKAHSGYNPPYASIVVDANTGKVLEDTNGESLRHPASLTKVMTLYLLFEELEAGKIKMSTSLPVSKHASDQAPSKLNLKPGDSISVENAIRAIVTKSANSTAIAWPLFDRAPNDFSAASTFSLPIVCRSSKFLTMISLWAGSRLASIVQI
jgi:D-alanyl-D-alanine carboxypeptidase